MALLNRDSGDTSVDYECRKLHVCHVLLDLEYGGLQTGIVNLIRLLPTDRYKHTLLCLSQAGTFAEKIKGHSDVIELHTSRTRRELTLPFRMARIFRSIRPDIVHTHNLPALDAIPVAGLFTSAAVIHTEHGLGEVELIDGVRRYIYLRRLYRHFVDQFVALGKELEQWLISNVRIGQEEIAVIYNGVDLKRFVPPTLSEYNWTRRRLLNVDRKTTVIGTVGRLSPIKNHMQMLEASATVAKNHDILVVIVGDGPERENLRCYAADRNLGDRTIIAGFQKNVAEWLRCFDIFLLPSMSEGLSNAILEAMATGLPVIAADTGGNGEIIENMVSGRLVAKGNISELSATLTELIENEESRESLGVAARERVVARFGIEQMAEAYDTLYRKVHHSLREI